MGTNAPLTAGSVKRPDWPHLAYTQRHLVCMPISRRRGRMTELWTSLHVKSFKPYDTDKKATRFGGCVRIAETPQTPASHGITCSSPAQKRQDSPIKKTRKKICHDDCNHSLIVIVIDVSLIVIVICINVH